MNLKVYVVAVGFILTQLNVLDVKAQSHDTDVDGNVFYGNVLERMENLEAREEMRGKENMELKQRVQALEDIVRDQQSQILNLKEIVSNQDDTNKQLVDRIQYLETHQKTDDSLRTEVNSQKTRIQFIDRLIKTMVKELPQQKRNDNEISTKMATRRRSVEHQINKRQNEENVAFFAYLSSHITNPGVHQIIAFDHVVTNIGNGYNAHAGDFRAPVAGTYVFATTLMAGDSSINYHFKIMHNAQLVSNIYITNGGTASQEVVLQLNQGDDVSIHNMDAGKKVYGGGYSTFSGFLLQQNYSSPGIVGR